VREQARSLEGGPSVGVLGVLVKVESTKINVGEEVGVSVDVLVGSGVRVGVSVGGSSAAVWV
jgi:hypothetical protein